MTLEVMRQACATCIYRKDSPLDLAKLGGSGAGRSCGIQGPSHLPPP